MTTGPETVTIPRDDLEALMAHAAAAPLSDEDEGRLNELLARCAEALKAPAGAPAHLAERTRLDILLILGAAAAGGTWTRVSAPVLAAAWDRLNAAAQEGI